MDLTEVEWEDMDWTFLVQDRDHWGAVVKTLMSLQVQ
jgi:hypothetical protein